MAAPAFSGTDQVMGFPTELALGYSMARLGSARPRPGSTFGMVLERHRRVRRHRLRAGHSGDAQLLTWSEIWRGVDNSERFRSSRDGRVSPGHTLKGASALHNSLASIFTAPGVTTWSDMSGNTRKNQVTRLVTLRHRSTMSGALWIRDLWPPDAGVAAAVGRK